MMEVEEESESFSFVIFFELKRRVQRLALITLMQTF